MKDIKIYNRETIQEDLDKLKKEGKNIWSISRLNNFAMCPRQYYLTYIEKAPSKQSPYTLLGSACHSDLEDLYTSETEKLIPKHFNDDWLKAELFNISFPVSKGDIKGNYKKDIDMFYNTYKKMDGKFISELGFVLQISDKDYIMGYIDLIQILDDNTVNIYDFKTSAMFKDKKLIEAGRQLCIYQLALEQLYGLNIKQNGWIMLKYSDVSIGDNKSKIAIQNKDIVAKSESQLKKLLIENGIDELISEIYLMKCKHEGDFTSLPEDIQEQIKITTHFKEYEITKEIKNETMKYIRDTIKAIDDMGSKSKEEWGTNYNSFFCKNLCSFFPNSCRGDGVIS